MLRKPKFRPVITRVKLNPEQAVLFCTCYSDGNYSSGADLYSDTLGQRVCSGIDRRTGLGTNWCCGSRGGRAGSYAPGSPSS